VGALRIERTDDVLRVTLARPETRNAFDVALIAELAEAFVDVGTARAVVLSGDGPSFCAGADVEWMRASVDLDREANVADATALRRMLDAIDTCPAPVVAVVHGHALGGGVGLVAVADVVLADPRTVFAFSEVKLGIVPAVISPFALRKIGESAARRYFVTGERFDAETALRIGLVHEIATDLDGTLERLLGELRTAGPRAARHAKRLVLDRPDGPETARRIAERRTSEEGQEGLRAFLERRRPSWAPADPGEEERAAWLGAGWRGVASRPGRGFSLAPLPSEPRGARLSHTPRPTPRDSHAQAQTTTRVGLAIPVAGSTSRSRAPWPARTVRVR
jgi:methylglutaconyl-CoA hydratase